MDTDWKILILFFLVSIILSIVTFIRGSPLPEPIIFLYVIGVIILGIYSLCKYEQQFQEGGLRNYG